MIKDQSPAPIKVAIVGLGRAGWGLHFQPLSRMAEFKIVAVADPLAERCAEAHGLSGCEAFSSIDELLERSEAELVVIATPSQFHTEDALKVLQSGRHCILEKPMALTAREADMLVQAAARLKRKLFIHHILLHAAEFHLIHQIVNSGKLGRIFHIRRFRGNYRWRDDWQTWKKHGGGILNNHGSHMLSTLLPLLGGRVSDVHADVAVVKDPGDAEDHVHLVLRTETGSTADLVISSAIALALPAWLICGQYGTLISDGSGFKIRYCLPEDRKGSGAKVPSNREEGGDGNVWFEEELTIPASPVAGFHQNVYEVLTHGAEQVITPESAAEVVRVTDLAVASLSARLANAG